ncbi:MAG: FAD-dependent oxidoreductase [Saprospiraceae bacterium]|nr:FAD-dependent oxidoreductase [Saprospiraceae bacterium]
MAEYNKPSTIQEVDENFGQIKPNMTATMAYNESSRCLFCFDAPCVKACPTSIDIPLFIRQIYTGNITGSAKTIYDSNYFGNICGKVCPTEVLCEGSCVYTNQNEPPIEIGRLQSFSTREAIQENKQLYTTAPANGKKVAIIGAGPAGIACACELRLLGYEVHIWEAKAHASGLTIYGVAPYKITNQEALDEVEYLQKQFGFQVFYNKKAETEAHFNTLKKDYDAVFLGIGLGRTRSLGLDGENLENCVGATEFIEKFKLNPLGTFIGSRVVVIGGGNTAMDAASETARMGAEQVYLAYRRSKDSMGAYEFEYDLAKGVGVQGIFSASPVAILGKEQVEGLRFIRTEVKNGKLVNIEGSEFDIACDMVVKATGQEKQAIFVKNFGAIDTDAKGRIIVNDQFQTTDPRVFAAGDAVNGGAEVVNAAGEAKKAAKGIHKWLSNL